MNIAFFTAAPAVKLLGAVAFDAATAGTNYTVPAGARYVLAKIWAGGGAGDGSASTGVAGGAGFAGALIPVAGGEKLTVRVAGGGAFGGGINGGGSGSGSRACGGGYSGLFRGTSPLLIAGGGGGSRLNGNGGPGGGTTGGSGGGTNVGTGGTQNAGGTGGANGAYLRGASGQAGGGGGYYGGGAPTASGGSQAGGGGSSFIAAAGNLYAVTEGGTADTPGRSTDDDYPSYNACRGGTIGDGVHGHMILHAYTGDPVAAGLISL